MTETKTKLEFTVEENCYSLPAIIVAAGNSTRMLGVNKQFAEIGGVPVIARSLLAFENSQNISRIILVVKADDVFELQMLAKKHNITKLSDIVCGGNSRQESVANGLARLGGDETDVLIHDGARPLVSQLIIKEVTEGLKTHKAVTCGVKLKDTVKLVNGQNEVEKTLPRDSLVAVQTPQGVNIAEYKKAIEKIGDISTFTDDTSIMEAAGHKVLTVQGSYKNIKITTPEDIRVAESYLREESL